MSENSPAPIDSGRRTWPAFTAAMTLIALLLSANVATAAENPPPAVTRNVDFTRDVKPILAAHCVKCHGQGKRKGGFSLDTRQLVVAGGETGPAVVAKQSEKSLLFQLVAGLDPDPTLRMPYKADPLSDEEIAVLRAWIDQGLPWEEGFTFGAVVRKTDLSPRRPTVPDAPPGSQLSNPIDRFLAPYFAKHGVGSRDLISDREFARRVHLDLIGVLPDPQELDAFLADTRFDKRERLVRKLLDDDKAYAEHWMTFWNDLLRNDYRGTGYIDGGRQQITAWLYTALAANKRYDTFVRELISAAPGAEGFTKGIVWRGTVNASQVPPMQASQNVAQVFMGINLKCASCHDSFINDWKLDEAYSLAAVFADAPLDVHRCNEPIGRKAEPKFLYPDLGDVDAKASRTQRQQQLAAILTKPENGRLARTMVNRLWAKFMGRGIIEPLDEMDQAAWHNDLLDWLACDFADNGYDLKRTMRMIVTSRAYQRAAVGYDEDALKSESYIFRGPMVRRMSAEQLVDAVAKLTGGWHNKPAAKVPAVRQPNDNAPRDDAPKRDAAEVRISAQWIWSHANAAKSDSGGRIFLRKVVQLPDKPTVADAVLTCDNSLVLYVNGKRIAASDDWQKPTRVNLLPHLVKGTNVIAAEAINWPDPITKKGVDIKGANPAGFVFFARIRHGEGEKQKVWDFGSDASWVFHADAPGNPAWKNGWNKPGYKATGWRHAAELAPLGKGIWKQGGAFVAAMSAPPTGSPMKDGDNVPGVRAVLVTADPLMRALDRPNREQVVTRRPTLATTLQALELTNGETLAAQLSRGANHWLGAGHADSRAMIQSIYRHALGRPPSAAELTVAADLVGSPATRDGVEDLLWVIIMLPEFQLIY